MELSDLYAAIVLGLLTALLYAVRLVGLRLQSDLERVQTAASQAATNTNGLLSELKQSLIAAIAENDALRLENERLSAIIAGRRSTDNQET